MPEVVFLNGRFVASEDARASVFEPGFLYGWGLFETMRAYNNRIVYLQDHLERIKNSCGLIKMGFPYPIRKIKEIMRKAIRLSNFQDAYVRLSLAKSARGTDVLLLVKPYRPYSCSRYQKGFRACVSRFKQNEGSSLSRMKTANYLLYKLALLEAKDKRLDEAIILNNRGYLAEGARSNLFFAKDNMLFTPALASGCLDGITRMAILNLAKEHNIRAQEGTFTLYDLYAADEAFLTNSLMGVMPLTYIEKHRIAKGQQGEITGYLIKKYNQLLFKRR